MTDDEEPHQLHDAELGAPLDAEAGNGELEPENLPQQDDVPPEEDNAPNAEDGAQGGHEAHNDQYACHGRGGDNQGEGSHQKLRRKMQGEFSPVIETLVNVSRNDALYMALGLAKRHHFSNTALCNAVQLINALFASPILPATIDTLDSLLNCKKGVNVKYFFYCKTCSELFGQLDFKVVKTHVCPKCRTRNLISDLRKAHFFVIFDVAQQLENLFQNQLLYNALMSPDEAVARSEAGFICDIWDGSNYKKFAERVRGLLVQLCRVISCHFCVDGSPLALTSSLFSIWPIQLAINELPPELRISNLILAGLWFGQKQARMDLFLEPFVNHFRDLSLGFYMKIGALDVHTHVFCIGSCVDSGARGKVQGIKTHSGYYSCNWCQIQGEWLGGAVRFPLTEERPPDRSHNDIIRLQHFLMNNPLPVEEDEEDLNEDPGVDQEERNLQGVNAVSPLINLPHFGEGADRLPSFNMVDSFFVDTMHMIDIGIFKTFLSRWLEDYGHEYYIKESLTEINNRVKSILPPLEFRRKPRDLSERARFNSRENHNWQMYLAVPVLDGIQRPKYLKLWMLLTQALYLVFQCRISLENLEIADTLINVFLFRTQEYYGRADMLFNLHILKHLIAHIIRNGPPWATNAYSFEDGNGRLKKIIHSNSGVPQQVIRALSWEEAFKILHSVVSDKAKNYVSEISQPEQHRKLSFVVNNVRVIGKSEKFVPTEEERYQCELHEHIPTNLKCYPKVVYRNCAYTDNHDRSIRFNNSVAQLFDKSIILIRRIIFDADKNDIFLVASNVLFETILDLPPGVRLDRDKHFLRKITHVNEELRYVKCQDLSTICFRATMPHGDYVAPMPNVFNRQ